MPRTTETHCSPPIPSPAPHHPTTPQHSFSLRRCYHSRAGSPHHSAAPAMDSFIHHRHHHHHHHRRCLCARRCVGHAARHTLFLERWAMFGVLQRAPHR
ncbi:hypothetical protein E2C01_054664 [Portunus trituberculatus]|uniref:Uncharacterized protein n=1 Tax=Portunus trituberculatus TaxID=210409 RepID=A0A5B7GKH3_PORTR|nr:hypothetical protein [Portunus trituberculatus]